MLAESNELPILDIVGLLNCNINKIMKKSSYLLVGFLLLVSFNAFSQWSARYYGTFKCSGGWESSSSKPNYDIFIDKKGVDDFVVLIQAIEKAIPGIYTNDDPNSLPRRSGIIISKNQLPGFVSNLSYAKGKYIEWVAVAKENGVSDLDKRIELKSQPVVTYFYFDGKKEVQISRRLIFNFGIIKYPSSSNNIYYYMTFGDFDNQDRSFLITISSSKEISDFINLLSSNKINAFLNKEKLFK